MNKYGAIYADPPWSFKTYVGPKVPQRASKQHYKTMELARLAGLGDYVRSVAADDCALFMWVVDSHLDQAMTLIEEWGFTYKTIAFVWDKGNRIGMGYWTRKQAEICLMATRGKPKRLDAGVRQLIREPRREHSRKPDRTRADIMRLVGGPYLEMFARQSSPEWDAFGDQTEKFNDPHTATTAP